jgi:hypothetical protein
MGSTPIASTIFYSNFMKKYILFSLLFFPIACFSIEISPTIGFSPKLGVSAGITLKENLLNAIKKFSSFAFNSKPVHGAAIGTIVTIILDSVIKSMFEQEENALITLVNNEKKPPTSLFFIAVASVYGAYLTSQPFESYTTFALDTSVAAATLAAAYFIWRLVLNITSDDTVNYSLKNNFKAALKHLLLHFSAIISSYGATKQLEKYNY